MTTCKYVLNKLLRYICALSPISFIVCILAIVSCITVESIETTELRVPEFESPMHKLCLLYFPFIFAIISWIFCLITCSSAVYGLYKGADHNKDIHSLFLEETSHTLIVTRCIFWMSLWDSLMNLWVITCWMLPLFWNKLYSELTSIILGMIGQIAIAASINWYLIITLLLIVSICCSVKQQNVWFYKIQLLGHISFVLIVLFPCLLVIILNNHRVRVFGYYCC